MITFSALHVPLDAFASRGTTIVPITTVKDGQCYGDVIHFQVDPNDDTKYYDIMDVSGWAYLLPTSQHEIENPDTGKKVKVDKCFFFVWSTPNLGKKTGMHIMVRGANRFCTSEGGAVESFKKAGVPIFVSTIKYDSQAILELFPLEEVDAGFVMGLVDIEMEKVYDMTYNMLKYETLGSYTQWKVLSYLLFSEETQENEIVTDNSAIVLNDSGAKEFYRDLYNGHIYLTKKRENDEETEETIQPYLATNYVETASFSNVVEYSYYTNKTIIVDPYIQTLNSILKISYPKYATEGDVLNYKLYRHGVLTEPLTVHIITNGYWCANASWEANSGGERIVRIKTGVDNVFRDYVPIEVLVKTINRKVETGL